MTEEWQHPVDFHMQRCRERLKSCDTEGALADIEEAIKHNRDISSYLTAGIIFNDTGEHDKAVEVYTALLAHYPDEIAGYSGRVTSYYFKHDYDKAIENMTAIIQLEPWFPEHYARRAQLHRKKEDFASMAADYTEAIRLCFRSVMLPQYYYFRGLAYMLMGESEYEKALADFYKVLEMDGGADKDAAKYQIAVIKGESPDRREPVI
jgi:tetratricopeptide (TPR) repeat protein